MIGSRVHSVGCNRVGKNTGHIDPTLHELVRPITTAQLHRGGYQTNLSCQKVNTALHCIDLSVRSDTGRWPVRPRLHVQHLSQRAMVRCGHERRCRVGIVRGPAAGGTKMAQVFTTPALHQTIQSNATTRAAAAAAAAALYSCHGTARGRRDVGAKKGRVHVIDASKVGHVCQVQVHHENIVRRAVQLTQHPIQRGQDVSCLMKDRSVGTLVVVIVVAVA
jgi:hypothetical protein